MTEKQGSPALAIGFGGQSKETKKRRSRRMEGYTLIEILVVITVMTLLTSVLLIYNRTGEQQIAIFKDQAKIINTILRAKNLAISTYTKGDAPCAFGVHFKDNEFRIFKDMDANGGNELCGDSENGADNIYTPGIDKDLNPPIIETLHSRLILESDFADIVFIPPDPKTIINGDDTITNGIITLSTEDRASSKTIKVNKFGQVTTD